MGNILGAGWLFLDAVQLRRESTALQRLLGHIGCKVVGNISDLDKLSAWFLNDKAIDRSDGDAFAAMMYNVQVKMKDAASAYADFKKNFPNSSYQYLIPKK